MRGELLLRCAVVVRSKLLKLLELLLGCIVVGRGKLLKLELLPVTVGRCKLPLTELELPAVTVAQPKLLLNDYRALPVGRGEEAGSEPARGEEALLRHKEPLPLREEATTGERHKRLGARHKQPSKTQKGGEGQDHITHKITYFFLRRWCVTFAWF
jgi:hypothetical protein